MSLIVLMVVSVIVTLVVSVVSIMVSTSDGVDWSLRVWDSWKRRAGGRNHDDGTRP